MKHRLITKLLIFGFAAIFLLGMAWDSTAQNDTVQRGKPPKDSVQDLSVCAYFNAGHLGIVPPDPLCDSSRGITAYVGRNHNIKVAIRKNLSNPYFSLDLTNPLDWIDGDPFPVAGLPPVPSTGGRISEPELQAGIEVPLIGLGGEIGTIARLYFKDDNDVLYLLHWGPFEFPGHNQRTNPDAPEVSITGYTDTNGKRNWSVHTQGQERGGFNECHTAFLWVSVSGPWEYVGAYNVSFSYLAIEE